MKQMKLLIIMVVLLIIILFLGNKTLKNNKYIEKYNRQMYDTNLVKKLLFLNVQEPYIAHFNLGTSYYNEKNYNEAKREFTEALKTVTEDRICDVRVNLALTEIYLTTEKMLQDDYLTVINNIQSILIENNCANATGKGRDKKAQDIYDYLEQLKNSQATQSQQGENGEGQEQQSSEEVIENEAEKIDQIKRERERAASGRNPSNEKDYNLDYNSAVW